MTETQPRTYRNPLSQHTQHEYRPYNQQSSTARSCSQGQPELHDRLQQSDPIDRGRLREHQRLRVRFWRRVRLTASMAGC
jgi:hypothetical protein